MKFSQIYDRKAYLRNDVETLKLKKYEHCMALELSVRTNMRLSMTIGSTTSGFNKHDSHLPLLSQESCYNLMVYTHGQEENELPF